MVLRRIWKRDGRLRKGVWPFRYEWYSFCSAHQRHNAKCELCQHGGWINLNRHAISSFVYKRRPDFWRWYVNGGIRKAFKRG